MGKVAKYKDIEFKHRKYDKNELILSVIFKAVCLILSSLSLYFSLIIILLDLKIWVI